MLSCKVPPRLSECTMITNIDTVSRTTDAAYYLRKSDDVRAAGVDDDGRALNDPTTHVYVLVL